MPKAIVVVNTTVLVVPVGSLLIARTIGLGLLVVAAGGLAARSPCRRRRR